MPEIHHEKHGGYIHVIDTDTGRLLKIIHLDGRCELEEITLPDGTRVWVDGEKRLQSAQLREVQLSPMVIDLLCEKIAHGMGLTEACQESGMPSYTAVNGWRRKHAWVEEALTRAREDRAESLRDRAMKLARDTEADDPFDNAKLQVDTIKWAAAVDSSRYSPRAKIEATITAPTQLVVLTGIDRSREVSETITEEITLPEKGIQKLEGKIDEDNKGSK
jgi:hypothetical protein